MKLKLSPEFPPEIKPVHRGVYKTSYKNSWLKNLKGYSYWDGEEWGMQWVGPEMAKVGKNSLAHQYKHWRGLAVKPKDKKLS